MSVAVELAGRGVDVSIVAASASESETHEIIPGLTVHHLRVDGELEHATDEFGEAFAALARESSFDAIVAHHWLNGIAVLPAAIELGVPLVQSFFSLSRATEPDRRWHSERFLAAQASAIIAESAAEAAVLIDELAAPADRVWVVPPGVDSELFAPRASDFFDIDPARAIVTVASDPAGVAISIGAIARLSEARSSADRPLLAVIGSPESVAGELATVNLARSHSVDVRFLGALDHDDVARVLAASDLVLIPHAHLSVSLVALEAAASGVPVIALDAAANPEAIAPGFTGLLVASREPAEWARAIGSLLADPAARAELGGAGRLRAQAFSWGASAASLMGVLAAVAAT